MRLLLGLLLPKGLLMGLSERLRLRHEVAVRVAFTDGVANGVVRGVVLTSWGCC